MGHFILKQPITENIWKFSKIAHLTKIKFDVSMVFTQKRANKGAREV